MPKAAGPAPLRVVFAASELAPLAQTGGLGDAVAGLAAALAARGHRVTCLLPAYASALAHPACPALEPGRGARIETGDGALVGRWLAGRLGAVAVELLELGGLFGGGALYGGADEGRRFAAFARAAAARAAEGGADALVAHDWQAALAICVLRTLYDRGDARGIGTLQAVHNAAHQGLCPVGTLGVTGLPRELFAPDGLEFHGSLSLLKGGLVWADRIVAVSPSYAREIQTPAGGGGLEGLYAYRAHRLVGIANGIDAERYDPARDAALAARFDAEDPAGRAQCRKALVEELGLETPEAGWLLACVGRLALQKGWDVLAEAAPRLVEEGAGLALLGDGDAALAARFERLAARWPRRIRLRGGWDEGLARRLYAGADAVLVPSRFEPCGLVQLLAQRYGALPVAHRVGGLRDTIRDGQTGVLFEPLSADALVAAARRGASLVRRGGSALVRRLLGLDLSWARPAGLWERELSRACEEAAARI